MVLEDSTGRSMGCANTETAKDNARSAQAALRETRELRWDDIKKGLRGTVDRMSVWSRRDGLVKRRKKKRDRRC